MNKTAWSLHSRAPSLDIPARKQRSASYVPGLEFEAQGTTDSVLMVGKGQREGEVWNWHLLRQLGSSGLN